MQAGFSWVIEDKLCGMPLPGPTGSLAADLSFLQSRRIGLLVSLTGKVPGEGNFGQYGIESLHIPVPDFHAPTMEQLRDFVAAVNERLATGQRVGVHCHAGKGRTGTFLAAYFVARGLTAPDAITRIREMRPGSVETAAQEEAIAEFANLISGAEDADENRPAN